MHCSPGSPPCHTGPSCVKWLRITKCWGCFPSILNCAKCSTKNLEPMKQRASFPKSTESSDKISTKTCHLTQNIQCEIQAQILDNLLICSAFQDFVPFHSFAQVNSWNPNELPCQAAQGNPLAQHNSLAKCGWVHRTRYSWGNMSTPLCYVKKSETNSLTKQTMRNHNMLRPFQSSMHRAICQLMVESAVRPLSWL